jgi:surface glycoprotein (TIGR04207 family)
MKKIISIALALVMVLSVFAFTASAESYEEKTIEVNWQLGYVGSSTNSSGFVNVLNPNGGSYSYSDVIDMGPAGSTISFADDASRGEEEPSRPSCRRILGICVQLLPSGGAELHS